jgi:hypothetical protein
MGSNWWGNKLGAAPTARPQAPVPGLQRTADQYLAQQQQQVVQQPQQPYTPPDPGDPHGHQRNIWSWSGNPRGGQGETATTGSCPNCFSTNYFSRRSDSITTQNGVMAPSPSCFECGYPRIQGNLGMPASVESGVQNSRQAPNAVPGSFT